MDTYALIVSECCNTVLAPDYATFPGQHDDTCAVIAVGTKDELDARVDGWPTKVVDPKPWGKFTACQMEDGRWVVPLIFRVGKASEVP